MIDPTLPTKQLRAGLQQAYDLMARVEAHPAAAKMSEGIAAMKEIIEGIRDELARRGIRT